MKTRPIPQSAAFKKHIKHASDKYYRKPYPMQMERESKPKVERYAHGVAHASGCALLVVDLLNLLNKHLATAEDKDNSTILTSLRKFTQDIEEDPVKLELTMLAAFYHDSANTSESKGEEPEHARNFINEMKAEYPAYSAFLEELHNSIRDKKKIEETSNKPRNILDLLIHDPDCIEFLRMCPLDGFERDRLYIHKLLKQLLARPKLDDALKDLEDLLRTHKTRLHCLYMRNEGEAGHNHASIEHHEEPLTALQDFYNQIERSNKIEESIIERYKNPEQGLVVRIIGSLDNELKIVRKNTSVYQTLLADKKSKENKESKEATKLSDTELIQQFGPKGGKFRPSTFIQGDTRIDLYSEQFSLGVILDPSKIATPARAKQNMISTRLNSTMASFTAEGKLVLGDSKFKTKKDNTSFRAKVQDMEMIRNGYSYGNYGKYYGIAALPHNEWLSHYEDSAILGFLVSNTKKSVATALRLMSRNDLPNPPKFFYYNSSTGLHPLSINQLMAMHSNNEREILDIEGVTLKAPRENRKMLVERATEIGSSLEEFPPSKQHPIAYSFLYEGRPAEFRMQDGTPTVTFEDKSQVIPDESFTQNMIKKYNQSKLETLNQLLDFFSDDLKIIGFNKLACKISTSGKYYLELHYEAVESKEIVHPLKPSKKIPAGLIELLNAIGYPPQSYEKMPGINVIRLGITQAIPQMIKKMSGNNLRINKLYSHYKNIIGTSATFFRFPFLIDSFKKMLMSEPLDMHDPSLLEIEKDIDLILLQIKNKTIKCTTEMHKQLILLKLEFIKKDFVRLLKQEKDIDTRELLDTFKKVQSVDQNEAYIKQFFYIFNSEAIPHVKNKFFLDLLKEKLESKVDSLPFIRTEWLLEFIPVDDALSTLSESAKLSYFEKLFIATKRPPDTEKLFLKFLNQNLNNKEVLTNILNNYLNYPPSIKKEIQNFIFTLPSDSILNGMWKIFESITPNKLDNDMISIFTNKIKSLFEGELKTDVLAKVIERLNESLKAFPTGLISISCSGSIIKNINAKLGDFLKIEDLNALKNLVVPLLKLFSPSLPLHPSLSIGCLDQLVYELMIKHLLKKVSIPSKLISMMQIVSTHSSEPWVLRKSFYDHYFEFDPKEEKALRHLFKQKEIASAIYFLYRTGNVSNPTIYDEQYTQLLEIKSCLPSSIVNSRFRPEPKKLLQFLISNEKKEAPSLNLNFYDLIKNNLLFMIQLPWRFQNIDLQANFWCTKLTNPSEYKDSQSLNDVLTRMTDKQDYQGLTNIVDTFLKSDIIFEDCYAKSLKNLIEFKHFKMLEPIYHSLTDETQIAKFHKLFELIRQDPNEKAEYYHRLVTHRLANNLPLTNSLVEAIAKTPESAIWNSNPNTKLLYQLIKKLAPNSNTNKMVQMILSCLELLKQNGIEKTDGSNLAPLQLLINLLSQSTFSPSEIQVIKNNITPIGKKLVFSCIHHIPSFNSDLLNIYVDNREEKFAPDTLFKRRDSIPEEDIQVRFHEDNNPDESNTNVP